MKCLNFFWSVWKYKQVLWKTMIRFLQRMLVVELPLVNKILTLQYLGLYFAETAQWKGNIVSTISLDFRRGDLTMGWFPPIYLHRKTLLSPFMKLCIIFWLATLLLRGRSNYMFVLFLWKSENVWSSVICVCFKKYFALARRADQAVIFRKSSLKYFMYFQN